MIGDRIRERRMELGLTQLELAIRMGYTSKTTINKVEMGINDVTQSNIVKYAHALNTSVEYILGLEESEGGRLLAYYNKMSADAKKVLLDTAKMLSDK